MRRESRSKLSRFGNAHPLMDMPRQVEQLEISFLNGGILFDLELPMAKPFKWTYQGKALNA